MMAAERCALNNADAARGRLIMRKHVLPLSADINPYGRVVRENILQVVEQAERRLQVVSCAGTRGSTRSSLG